jgi:hypothetical protein
LGVSEDCALIVDNFEPWLRSVGSNILVKKSPLENGYHRACRIPPAERELSGLS